MQHLFMILALDLANERAREASAHRLGERAREARPARRRRLLERLAGNVRAAFTGRPAPATRTM